MSRIITQLLRCQRRGYSHTSFPDLRVFQIFSDFAVVSEKVNFEKSLEVEPRSEL
jgi:hypothetical protein